MAIRYDKQLSREIARTVRNFNAKVRRLEKIRRELVPERVSVASLKEEFTSRADLKRRLRELRGFSARGAEEIITTKGGAKTTRYEYKMIKERARISKIRISRTLTEIGKIAPTVYGKKQAHKYSEMGSEEISNLKARRESLSKDISKLNQEQFKRYKERVFNDYSSWNSNKGKKFFDSYMDIIDKAGYMAGVPQAQIEHIKNALSSLSIYQFGMIMSESVFKTILDRYIQMKIQAGVLSVDDEQELREIFEELDNNIDEMVEQYKNYNYSYRYA